MRSHLLRSTAGLTVCLLATIPALAQTRSVPIDPAASGSATAGNGDYGREILVTGSRIANPGLLSLSPILAVTPLQIQRAGGVTLEQAVNQLPQVYGAFTAQSQENPRGGQSTIDLRALGPNRTLMLLDGRRLTPAADDGSADLNVVPEGLLKRVDVVTGGASAAYGSDAIAGVVNFVLDHRYEGLKFDAQNGISSRGDAGSRRFELTGGGSFAGGRGHIVATASYTKRDFLSTQARTFATPSRLSSTLPTGVFVPSVRNLPSQAAADAVFARYGIAPGTVANSDRLSLNDDRTLFVPVDAINFRPVSAPNELVSDGTVYFANGAYNPLSSPFEKVNGFGRAEYALTPDVTGFVQANFARYTNGTRTGPASAVASSGSQLSIPVTNPFIPADIASLLASRPNPSTNFGFARRMTDLGPQIGRQRNATLQATVGLSGEHLPGGWSWDVSYTYGQVRQRRAYRGGFDLDRLQTLASATDGGRSLCSGGFDPFTVGSLSTACIAYITPAGALTNRQRNTQHVAEANLRGSLFDLPAGPVSLAVGVDYRRDGYRFVPDSNSGSDAYIGAVGTDGDTAVAGHQTAKEAYAEILVPILRDMPFFKALEANGAYRYSRYNTVGGIQAYKGALQWRPVSALLLRGSYQRAVRAPSIGELFSPRSTTSQFTIGSPASGLGDPCDIRGGYRSGSGAAAVRALCVAQGVPAGFVDRYTYGSLLTPSSSGGNTGLKEERADTFSAGAVLSPGRNAGILSTLTVSADYYSIRLKRAVGTIDPTTALQRCFNVGGFNPGYSLDNAYCRLIVRDPATGEIADVAGTNQNLGQINTAGIDIGASWRLPLEALGTSAKAGAIGLQMNGTRLTRYSVSANPGEEAVSSLGTIGGGIDTTFPKWRSTVTISYLKGESEIAFSWRYISAMRDASTIGSDGDPDAIGVPAYSYFDLTGSIAVTSSLTLRAGINNLADKQPPIYTSAQSFNTNPRDYDVYGRRFFIGASAKF